MPAWSTYLSRNGKKKSRRNSGMAEDVLDSSAILTVLQSELGAQQISELTERSRVSVVNEAEGISVLIQKGSAPYHALGLVLSLPYELVDLDRKRARRAGTLWREFKPRGLSLGDRCCLALAEREGLPALTT